MKYIGNFKDFVKDDIDAIPPLPVKRQYTDWSVHIFEPGKVEYVHTDQFLTYNKNPVKYYMFLTDWEIGHIFTYGEQMLADYKAGDLFEVDDSSETIFSIANIGYSESRMLEIKLHGNLEL